MFEANFRVYGVRKRLAAIAARGLRCGPLHGCPPDEGHGPRRYHPRQADPHHGERQGGYYVFDHVNRQFHAPAEHAMGLRLHLRRDLDRLRLCRLCHRHLCPPIVGWRVSRTAHASFVLTLWNRFSMIGGPCREAGSCTTAIEAAKADSGRRNTLTGVAMNIRKRRSDRSGRVRLFSPGRPPVAGREERRRFWAAIAAGTASEDAVVGVGVLQAVGTRWFRKAGGMPPSMFGLSAKPLCGRYLSLRSGRRSRPRSGLLHAGGRSPARASGIDNPRELRRNAATRSGGLAYRATTAHASALLAAQSRRSFARNAALRTYVEERLAGVVVAPSGLLFPARPCPGKAVGTDHGRTGDGQTPEPGADRPSPGRWTSRTTRPCASAEAIYQALFVQGRGALRRELDGLLAHRARVADAEGAHARARQGLHLSRDHDQPTSGGGGRSRRAGPLGRRLILGLGSSAIGTLVERTTRFTLLLYLPRMAGHGHEARVKNGPALAGHGAEAVRDATSHDVTLLEQLRRSLTWDQGAEMAQHARLKIEAGASSFLRSSQPMATRHQREH